MKRIRGPEQSFENFSLLHLIWLVAVTFFISFPAQAEYGDVVLNKRSEKAAMRPVIFSHWFHRIRYKCNVCHSELGFVMRAGADDIRMSDITGEKFCGACHNDKIAWGPKNCQLCHSGLPGLKTGIQGGDTTDGPGKW